MGRVVDFQSQVMGKEGGPEGGNRKKTAADAGDQLGLSEKRCEYLQVGLRSDKFYTTESTIVVDVWALVPSSVPSLPSCVTVGKSLNLSVFCLDHL